MKSINRGQASDQSGKLDRRTLLLAAFALFLFGSFLGCAIYRLLGIGQSELYDKLIERYFLSLFQKCGSAFDVVLVVLDSIAHELWMFALVFVFGFTPFCAIVGTAMLLYKGLLFGFSLTMLQFSTKLGLFMVSGVYLICEFAISALLGMLAAEAILFYVASPKIKLSELHKTGYTSTFFGICALCALTVAAMLFLIHVYI